MAQDCVPLSLAPIAESCVSDAPYSFWLGNIERERPAFVVVGDIDASVFDWVPGNPIRLRDHA